MLDVTLKVTLTLRGPVITKSTAAGGFGIDAAFAKDEHGRHVIPRGLIKGKLKQSAEELGELGQPHKLLLDSLGQMAEGEQENYAPRRGHIDFSPFVLDGQTNSNDSRFRISVDEDRGAAKKGAYQVIESLAPSGGDVSFTGNLKFYAIDETAEKVLTDEIRRSFSFITNLGADKSTGFGELIGVGIEASSKAMTSALAVDAPDPGPDVLDLTLSPKSPFCIAKPRKSNNTFECETVISGGVIKGCIANTWLAYWNAKGVIDANSQPSDQSLKDLPELSKNFDRIRFTHAFPSKDHVRPVVIPYSAVTDGNGDLHDVSHDAEPRLFGERAPAFQIDWKSEWDKANAEYGWVDVPTIFEVRNQHDRHHRKAADEELFSMEMAVPHYKDAAGREIDIKWICRVDFSGIADDTERGIAISQFKHLLECLQSELRFLGKTKSRMGIEVSTDFISDKVPPGGSDTWPMVITLQTPALLCDPFAIGEGGGEAELRKAYEDAWTDISGGTMSLNNYFAGQHLAGGEYVHRRFIQTKAYNPFLLTDAGSVFVLNDTGRTDDRGRSAKEVVADWLAHGLTLPKWASAKERHGDSWQTNPYVRENGFGEITINLPRQVKEVHNGQA